MKSDLMKKIFNDTAYVRMGGSAEERRVAEYLKTVCADMGLEASFEEFEVDMAEMEFAELLVDGVPIPCHGYRNCGSGEAEAELYYLASDDKYALSQCKGKIVLFDGYLGYWRYRDLLANGALAFISYDGNVNYSDRDIDRRELRSYVSQGEKILGVNINAKDAVAIVNGDAKTAKITVRQKEYKGTSQNVVLDLPGQCDRWITLMAHYDSTSLSQGAYDNMSGCVGLLSMAEYFSQRPHLYGLRFIWCGSEERGLLGSKAYCTAHENELESILMDVNLDMIGCVMGKFCSICTAEQKLVHYLSYLGDEIGLPVSPIQEIHSSDSTPFADKGIPTASFVRRAPANTATIHNRYDTQNLIKLENMQKDIAFITAFVERMANAKIFPVAREIPEEMKVKLDEYLCRKRKA